MHEHIVIPRDSAGFPNRLNVLEDVPVALYTSGDTSALSKRPLIAIVGKRDCTDFGARCARELAVFLTGHGYNIVSGLALGIDTAAHYGALEAGGQTVAVLHDIKSIIPKSNSALASEILEKGGLLLAENPPGSAYAPKLLIRRNRIIAALASAVFIIETDGSGGAVHTLRYARECRRPVFCIHPEVLDRHSIPSYAAGIGGIVKEPGTWVYHPRRKDQLLGDLNQATTHGERNTR